MEPFKNILPIVIHINPKATPRIRIGKCGNAYNEHWYNEYLDEISRQIKKATGEFFKRIETPCGLEIVFAKDLVTTNKQYGDIDNLIKGVMDACTGIIYKDDKQVIEISARKSSMSMENLVGIYLTIHF